MVFGKLSLPGRLLRRFAVSTTINTSFVERHDATDRHQDSRKRRKTCGSSRDLAWSTEEWIIDPAKPR